MIARFSRNWLFFGLFQLVLGLTGAGALLAHTVSPGAPDFLWAQQIGLGGIALGSGIEVDQEGNSYVVGMSQGNIDAGGSTLTNGGGFDGFLAKYDRNGTLLWARQAGGSLDESIKSVAIDAAGNIYVAGSSKSTNGTFAGTNLGNDGGQDFFLAKLKRDGDLVWLRHGAGPESESAVRVAVDPAGNCFLTGYFFGTNLVFGGTVLSNRALLGNNGCSADVFLAKYSADGVFEWVQQFGTACLVLEPCVTTDPQGNCYVGGSFTDTAPFGSTNLHAVAGYNAFVAKYGASGQIIWARELGGAVTVEDALGHYNSSTSVKVAPDGNIFVAGIFESFTATFDSFTLTNAAHNQPFNYKDSFLAKLNPAGAVLWVNGSGGQWDDSGASIAVDASGNCYLTVACESPTVTIAELTLTNSSSGGSSDMFFCRYDPAGHLDWVRQTRGNSEEFGYVTADAVGNVYTTGAFRSTNLQFGSAVLGAHGFYGAFVSKLDTSVRPSLASVRSGSSLLLSWNPLFSGFRLESSDVCCDPSAWVGYPPDNSTSALGNTLEIPLTESPRFFRLAKP